MRFIANAKKSLGTARAKSAVNLKSVRQPDMSGRTLSGRPTISHLTYLCLASHNRDIGKQLLRARRNEKEMKVKPAASFKLLTIFIHKKIR